MTYAKATNDRYSIRTARGEVRTAKRNLSAKYKQLKKDYKADQGKELYQQGRTITGNQVAGKIFGAGVTIGIAVTGKILKERGHVTVRDLPKTAIPLGISAVSGLVAMKIESDNNKLRAYYSHSRKS